MQWNFFRAITNSRKSWNQQALESSILGGVIEKYKTVQAHTERGKKSYEKNKLQKLFFCDLNFFFLVWFKNHVSVIF